MEEGLVLFSRLRNMHFEEGEALHHKFHPFILIVLVLGIPAAIDTEFYFLLMISAGIVGIFVNTLMKIIQSRYWETEKPNREVFLVVFGLSLEFSFILASFEVLSVIYSYYPLFQLFDYLMQFSMVCLLIGYAAIMIKFIFGLLHQHRQANDVDLLLSYDFKRAISASLMLIVFFKGLLWIMFFFFGNTLFEIILETFFEFLFVIFEVFTLSPFLMIPIIPFLIVTFSTFLVFFLQDEFTVNPLTVIPTMLVAIFLISQIYQKRDNKASYFAYSFALVELYINSQQVELLFWYLLVISFVQFYWKSSLNKFEQSFGLEIIPNAINDFIVEQNPDIKKEERAVYLVENIQSIAVKVRAAQSVKGYRIPVVPVQQYLSFHADQHLDDGIWKNTETPEQKIETESNKYLWPTLEEKQLKKGRKRVKKDGKYELKVPKQPEVRRELLLLVVKNCLIGFIPFLFLGFLFF